MWCSLISAQDVNEVADAGILMGESRLTCLLAALQLLSGGQARRKAHIIILCLLLVSTPNVPAERKEDCGTAAIAAQAFLSGSGKGMGVWAGETCFGLFIIAVE